jgi:hypothetical protein
MRVKPWEDLDLETHWGWLPVQGKVVLDVGAEHGSTADFFLTKGAAGVIAVEGDPRSFRRLKALADQRGSLQAVEKRISSVADWRKLLTSRSAQVVKVDCEGCEGFLLDLDDKLFRKPEVWAVELHTREQAERWGNPYSWGGVGTLWMRFLEKLLDSGYEIVKDVPHGLGRVACGTRGDPLLVGRPGTSSCTRAEVQGTSESRTWAAIVSTQRSGTRLLEECLASHPDVEGGGEVLREAPPWPIHTLQDFFEGGEAEVRVCRLMYNQLSAPVVLWLQMNEVSIIHLIREDHVRREVSNWINRQKKKTGRPSDHAYEEWEPVQMEVDVAWVARQIQQVKAQIEGFRNLFEGGPYLEVTYREMVGWEGEEISELPRDLDVRLFRFLELAPHPLTSSQRKQNPGDLSSFVLNYEELMAAVGRV